MEEDDDEDAVSTDGGCVVSGSDIGSITANNNDNGRLVDGGRIGRCGAAFLPFVSCCCCC